MKYIALLMALVATRAFAATGPSIKIDAKYSGFDPALLGDVDASLKTPGEPLVAPSVTVTPGQRAVIEMVKEIDVPGQSKPADAGAILDVNPTLQGNQVTLTGKSTVRHLLKANGGQPLGAVSFTARETYFSDAVEFGKPFVIHVGDGPADKAQITLVVEKTAPEAAVLQGPPKLRLVKLDATPDAINKVCAAIASWYADHPLGRSGPDIPP